MANEGKELYRFVNEPKYRQKIIGRIHKEQDRQYEKRIGSLRSEKKRLISQREKEISRISAARWESVAGGKLLVNVTEGKVKLNRIEVLFSDIQGAEINFQSTYRVVTEGKGKSKRHASIGGGIVGGVVAGPVGAVVGGIGLGKTTTKKSTVCDQIPMCSHIGVLVNINGFISEIVLLSKQVEQSSSACIKAQNDAQSIIAKLIVVSKLPVPTVYLKVEEEPSVKKYDERIVDKEEEIQVAIDDKPVYEIPAMYRTDAQKDMSDDEYLSYLTNEDTVRANEYKTRSQEINKKTRAEVGKKTVSIIKKILSVIIDVFCWALSMFALIFALPAVGLGGIASMIIFIVSALSVNPLIYKVAKSKIGFLRKWMCVLLFVVAFIIGLLVFPVSETPDTAQAITTEISSMGW